MAETKKAAPKPKKPRAPKPKIEEPVAVPTPEITEEIVPDPVPEIPVEEPAPVEEAPVVEETPKEEEKPASGPTMEELAESYRDFSESLRIQPAEIRKLNPNLPDTKSKWVAQFPTKTGGYHVLFKGAYARAYRRAENWNVSRGLPKHVKEIRSK